MLFISFMILSISLLHSHCLWPLLSDLISQLFSSLIPPVLPSHALKSPYYPHYFSDTWSANRWWNKQTPWRRALQPSSCLPAQSLMHMENICLLSDFFGDRVLNLESGVDFDEVVLAMFVHQEFHGASVLVAHLQGNNTAGEHHLSCEWILFQKCRVVAVIIYLSVSGRQHKKILALHSIKLWLHKHLKGMTFNSYRRLRGSSHYFSVSQRKIN